MSVARTEPTLVPIPDNLGLTGIDIMSSAKASCSGPIFIGPNFGIHYVRKT